MISCRRSVVVPRDMGPDMGPAVHNAGDVPSDDVVNDEEPSVPPVEQTRCGRSIRLPARFGD